MDQRETLEVLLAHQMGETIALSPEERASARRQLSKSVLITVGRAAISGDAAAARLLFDMKVLRLP